MCYFHNKIFIIYRIYVFYFFQIIGTIPLMPNPVSSNQAAGGAQGLQIQPITPQLLTNAQGQIIATGMGFCSILPLKWGGNRDFTVSFPCHAYQATPTKPRHAHQVTPTELVVKNFESYHWAQSVYGMTLHCGHSKTSSEVDGVNLEEIREFAKAFKIRRLSLGLTQTQVGQALSATEGPAYSQSAICRFEKLDITPKSAQKIKPVLERWMAEAEARHRAGMQNLTEFIGSEPSKKRKRRTSFTPQALEILNAHFEKNTHPSGQEMTEIAQKLNYDREVVRVWFCNKRQALKNTIKRLKQNEPVTAAPMEPLTDSLKEDS
uniref:POU domain protein n=1 Tax=Naja naja TaxID=35670 RepID=A0A8C6YC45_NAJNA